MTEVSPVKPGLHPADDEISQTDAAAAARGKWGSQLEFILTSVGYAVGLGNVWRFPYLCFKNGGGAFLIPYFLMLILIGIPLFYLEMCLGQFSSQGPITMWTLSPIFKGVGYGMISFGWIVAMYYNVVNTYSWFYLFSSFTDVLPYQRCDHPDWNDYRCIIGEDIKALRENETLLNQTLADLNMTSLDEFQSPSEQFFYKRVIKQSSGIDDAGPVIWELALCLLLVWVLTYLILIKGVQSLGKAVYFVSTFPYVMMTILLIRGATLDGAGEGVVYYLKPEIDKLTDPQVWSDAANQIFYTLSACTGGLHAMSSYNNFHNNAYRDTFLIPIINCFTSLYAGFTIFTVLGFMAKNKGVNVDAVAESGPGLTFVVYPEALTQMPIPTLWAILFFFMMITLGLSSQITTVETFFTSIFDVFPWLRMTWRRTLIFKAVAAFSIYLLTLPMLTEGGFYLFALVDTFVGGLPLICFGIVELLAVQWVYGYDNFADDIRMMIGKRPNIYFKFCWSFLSPTIIAVMVISSIVMWKDMTLGSYVYPEWATTLGWLIVAFMLMWTPIFFIWEMCAHGGWEAIKKRARPEPEWGPALKENRTGRYAESRHINGDIEMNHSPDGATYAETRYTNGDIGMNHFPDGATCDKPSIMNHSPDGATYDNPSFIGDEMYKF